MTATAARNPYFRENFLPVNDEVSAVDLPVTGELPRELSGRYLRIGPNPVGNVDAASHHWFMGEGMVHGVRLRDGRAEWYRNRFVRGDSGESPNTNVLAHAGRIMALVEAGGLPVTIAPDLNKMATWDCDGLLKSGYAAHPKIDPITGELHAITYNVLSPSLRYVVLDATGAAKHVTDIAAPGRPMVHDMALTQSRVVVLDLPVTVSMDMMSSWAAAGSVGYPPLPMRWDDAHTSRIGLLPRGATGDAVRWFEAPRCYVFHVLNGFDNPDGSVTVDVVRYDSVFRDELRGPSDSLPVLARWTVDPARGTVTEQIVSDRSVEFPRVGPALVGQPHRYGWFAGVGADGLVLSDDVDRSSDSGFETGPLVKIDTATGGTELHHYGPGRVTMEPAFVARPGATGEDDGWILSVVHDATTDRGELVVLDAGDITAAPVARVHLPRRVPFGFHGNWISDDELT
ncbi:carotenoid oxygenase family protein [Pseudonocardia sp. TRM90224]|uniref:carotenoid oxygenase family protein n=1 Tax=Pseudonocardia sp. TRM90224 TaxID=2812678 RepID=UPI001E3BF2A1|nr:carotenoid oxygenase family protein [Pseudonocardia sp. TRM90224]